MSGGVYMARVDMNPHKKFSLFHKQEKYRGMGQIWQQFTLQGILIHLIGFLLGRVVVLGRLSPLGIAYYAGVDYKKINPYSICITICLGMVTAGTYTDTFKYIGVMGIMLLSKAYDHHKQKESKVMYRAFVGAGAVLCMGLLIAAINGMSMYYGIISVLESILVFTLVCIYDKCMPIFWGNLRRKILSNEEIISISILFSGVIAGVADIGLYGIQLRDIMSFLIIMILSFRGGSAVGTSVGVIVGLIVTMSGYTQGTMIGVLGVAGMSSGLLRDLGKMGSVMGFFLGSTILTFYFERDLMGVFLLIPMSIAAFIFLLLPKKLFDSINTIVSCDRSLQEEEYINRVRDVTAEKLKGFSKSFYKLAKTFSNLSEKKTGLSQKEVAKLFDDVADKVCKDCGLRTHCWELDFYNTYQTVFSILGAAEKKGKIDYDDIPRDFIHKCAKLDRFMDTTNRMYDLYKFNLVWHNRIVESRELVSEQLMGVASIVGNLSKDIYIEMNFKEDFEEAIKVELDKNRIGVNNVIVLENKYGKYEVTLTHRPCYGRRICIRDILPVVSKVLGKKMKQTHNNCSISKEQNECTLRLIEEQRYRMTTGVAKMAKQNHAVSGDSYSCIELKDGQCMMALSDGMGSGNKASTESAAAIELLEQFMESGFEKDTAVKMINSVLVLKSNEESFSTLDICVVDLYSGLAEFVKIGAAATFIKRGDEVEVIRSTSLPVGMLNRVDMEVTKRKLKDGDMIIMVTDGILDSKEKLIHKEKWVEKALWEIRSNNPQDIADYLLQEAKSNAASSGNDDMTVLAARVWEKY